MSITWEEPPSGSNTRWASVVAELRQHPGRWAKIRENGSSSLAPYLRDKYPGIEARTVTAGLGYKNNRADIYARWNGDTDLPAWTVGK